MANPTELSSIFSTLIKEINEAGQSDVLKGSIGSIKALHNVIQEQDKLIDKTLRAGDERSAMRIIKRAKEAQEAQVEATNNLRDAKEKLLKLEQEGSTKARDAQIKVIGKINQEINKLAREAKLMQKNATQFTKGAEHSLTQYTRVLENREERIKELGKTGALIEEKFSNRFEASVNAFTSGVGDLESFGDTFAGGLKSLGGFLQERAGKAAEKAAAGKGELGVADMLGGLSKVIGTLAVVGGSIMMLVKLFKFVEGTVIEANKALLDGGVAINDLYVVGLEDTNKNLELVRNTFRDPDFANAMGIPLADTMGLVTAFNNLNMGMKKFGGGKEGMERMKDAMKSARGFAYGLGISMDEAQQYMAKFTHDLGMSVQDGSAIAKMTGDFASIRDMALQSSYSTGNFFKKVTELTDQLENMNYRTKEAGTLVLRFASVLGKSGLDKALQSLFSGFRGEGYLEQMKRNMMAKSDEVKKALRVEAIKFGKAFKESFGGADGEGGMNALLMKQVGARDEKDLIKKLSQLDNKGRQKLFSDMKAQDVSEEFIDQLYKFVRLSRGTKDKATAAEVQGAQEEMGAGGNLKTKFALIEARIGDRDINDAGVITKEMLTKFDVTKEQIEVFAQLQTTMKGDLRRAQELAKGGRELTEDEKKFLTEQGLSIEDGKLVMHDTKEAVNNFSDYLQAQDEAKFKELKPEEAAKTQEQYLSEGVNATTSVFNVLNNTIAGILNDISGGIYNLVSFFFSEKEDDTEKKNKKEAIRIVSERAKSLAKQKKSKEDTIKAEKERLHDLSFKKDMDKEEKEQFKRDKENLAKDEKDLVELKAKESRSRAQLRTLQSTTYDEGVGKSYSKEHMLTDSSKYSLAQRRRTGTETGELGEYQKKAKEFYAPIVDIIGDASTKALLDYLETGYTWSEGVDPRVAEFMAKHDLSTEKTERTASSSRSANKLHERRLLKGGESVAKLSRKTSRGSDRDLGERIYDTGEQKLTAETIKELNAPLPKGERDRLSKESAKATEGINRETQKQAFIEAKEHMKEKELKAIAKVLNSSTDVGEISKAFEKANENQKRRLRGLSLGGNKAVRRLMGYTEAPAPATPAGAEKVKPKDGKDILVTDSGEVWRLDRQDQFTPMSGGGYAMSKPGGAIDEYIGSRIGGGGGGSFNITINIDGTKSPVETGREVVRQIRKAQESVMGGPR